MLQTPHEFHPQKHIWTVPDGNGTPPPNHAPAVFAACPGGHLLAYVQQPGGAQPGGQQQQIIQVLQQETLTTASTIRVGRCNSSSYTATRMDVHQHLRGREKDAGVWGTVGVYRSGVYWPVGQW